jgi:SAM-dependent methyltransferase
VRQRRKLTIYGPSDVRNVSRAIVGNAIELPFAAASFDVVCALDIVEHAHGTRVLTEIGRVLRREGLLLVAVPLYSSLWTEYDRLVGHHLRYEPKDLVAILENCGLQIRQSATFGILPRNRLLVRTAAWVLSRLRGPAIWFEDRLVLPVAGLLQKPLRLKPGFHVDKSADGVILLREKK